MSHFVVRQLGTHAERRACVALQRMIWGDRFGERIPATLLKVAPRIGGLALGAFNVETDQLVGFLFGVTGVVDGRTIHWSSTVGVDPNVRDSGIGRALKEYQRAEMLNIGVKEVYWTYDPLVARNAHLNINRLRALPVEYAVDMYDSKTFGDVQDGIGTDRFVVCWKIAKEPNSASCSGLTAAPDQESAPITVIGVTGPRPDSPMFAGGRILVEIPWEIDEVQRASQKAAGCWREVSRDAFLLASEHGYKVIGFRRDHEQRRAYYELEMAYSGEALRAVR